MHENPPQINNKLYYRKKKLSYNKQPKVTPCLQAPSKLKITKMLVSGFMIPASKVVKVIESDTIGKVVDLMTEKKISAVVVVDSTGQRAIGLVTKTELLAAYKAGTPLQAKVGTIMKTDMTQVKNNVDRDMAAKAFENTGDHHAIVMDSESSNFVGLISTWDIAAECAKDSRAWPWPRTADGHAHPLH